MNKTRSLSRVLRAQTAPGPNGPPGPGQSPFARISSPGGPLLRKPNRSILSLLKIRINKPLLASSVPRIQNIMMQIWNPMLVSPVAQSASIWVRLEQYCLRHHQPWEAEPPSTTLEHLTIVIPQNTGDTLRASGTIQGRRIMTHGRHVVLLRPQRQMWIFAHSRPHDLLAGHAEKAAGEISGMAQAGTVGKLHHP